MAQLAKCLLYKYEDLSSIPQTPHNISGCGVNLSIQEAETSRSLKLFPRLTSGLNACAQTPEYTSLHTHTRAYTYIHVHMHTMWISAINAQEYKF